MSIIFTPNTIIASADVNLNFADLVAKDNDLFAKVVAYYNTGVSFNPGDAAQHDITGWTVTLTVPTGTHDVKITYGWLATYTTIYGATPYLFRDSTQVHTVASVMRAGQAITMVGGEMVYVDSALAAGTYVYKVVLAASGSISPAMTVTNSYIEAEVMT